MKRIIFLLACIALISCTSTQKSVKSTWANETSLQSMESQSTKTGKVIDTTKTESGKITITEIEFYPPPNDTASNAGGVDLPNIKDAAIKSIRQTIIETGSEQKGKSKESSESNERQKEAIISNTTQKTDEVIAPAPDPYRWRYIFYILLLITAIFLYVKRIPVLNWIKKILSGIRKII
jgi:hypothetical protein